MKLRQVKFKNIGLTFWDNIMDAWYGHAYNVNLAIDIGLFDVFQTLLPGKLIFGHIGHKGKVILSLALPNTKMCPYPWPNMPT